MQECIEYYCMIEMTIKCLRTLPNGKNKLYPVNSVILFLCLFFHLPMTWTLSIEEFQDTSHTKLNLQPLPLFLLLSSLQGLVTSWVFFLVYFILSLSQYPFNVIKKKLLHYRNTIKGLWTLPNGRNKLYRIILHDRNGNKIYMYFYPMNTRISSLPCIINI